jgi:hypothetical protein
VQAGQVRTTVQYLAQALGFQHSLRLAVSGACLHQGAVLVPESAA